MELAVLIATLEMLVLERLNDGSFVRRGAAPAWCLRLDSPALRDAPFAIAAAFPFLEPFVESAERAFRVERSPRMASGFFSETGLDGEELHLEASVAFLGTAEVLMIARNERRYSEQQLILQQARELRLTHDALLQETEQRQVLCHTLLHEMAVPLHNILSLLSLASELPLTQPGAGWVQSALDSATRQRQLIGEVLEVFSVENAAPPQDKSFTPDLTLVIQTIREELKPLVRLANVQLEVECPPALAVAGEPRRLSRMLQNLLDNAIRNSPKGGLVRITTQLEGGWVFIAVEDQGPAVPIEYLPQLFEKNAQSHGRVTGTPLGLYFCRITVESWGGGIGYDARSEGGARFWVRLPMPEQRLVKEELWASSAAKKDSAQRPAQVSSFERELAAKNLERSLSLLKTTLEATLDGILVVDRTGRVMLCNERLRGLWKLPAFDGDLLEEETLLRQMAAQVEDPDGFCAGILELQARPESELSDVLRCKDGRVFERHSLPQRVGEAIVGRVYCYRDISENDRILQRALCLADATRLLASLDIERALEAVAHLMVPCMGDGCAVELFEDEPPRRFLFMPRDGRYKLPLEVHPAVRAGRSLIYQVDSISYLGIPFVSKGVTVGAMTLVLAPPRNYTSADLEFAGRLGCRAALAFENARLYLGTQEALRLRDEFLSIAAHELRGPLHSLHIAVQMLKGGMVSKQEQANIFTIIERADRRLAQFVDQLLDVSRIRAGALGFDPQELDLGELVHNVVAQIRPEAARTGSALSIHVAEPVLGKWDRFRLEQVITNLLTNATKFGLGRPIDISLKAQDGRAILAVKDRGTGIAREIQDRIFRPFERGVQVRHYGGLGLGLYIVKTIVEGMGGGVRLESSPGEGSTFTVELPLFQKLGQGLK
jgi:signal transduction histidine kinase